MRLTIQGGADAMSAAGTKDGATGEPCSDQFAATGGGAGNGKLRSWCLLGGQVFGIHNSLESEN